MSEGYGHWSDVLSYFQYNNYLHPNYHSIHKRSPMTPFIAKATKSLSIPKAVKFNPLICKLTKCLNKKTGLVL